MFQTLVRKSGEETVRQASVGAEFGAGALKPHCFQAGISSPLTLGLSVKWEGQPCQQDSLAWGTDLPGHATPKQVKSATQPRRPCMSTRQPRNWPHPPRTSGAQSQRHTVISGSSLSSHKTDVNWPFSHLIDPLGRMGGEKGGREKFKDGHCLEVRAPSTHFLSVPRGPPHSLQLVS